MHNILICVFHQRSELFLNVCPITYLVTFYSFFLYFIMLLNRLLLVMKCTLCIVSLVPLCPAIMLVGHNGQLVTDDRAFVILSCRNVALICRSQEKLNLFIRQKKCHCDHQDRVIDILAKIFQLRQGWVCVTLVIQPPWQTLWKTIFKITIRGLYLNSQLSRVVS